MGRTVRLGAGMAFWGDSVQPAIEMVDRGEIDYLCCDHLAELTMSILSKRKAKDPSYGYTRDIARPARGALPTALARGVKVVTNAGGANPRACAEAVAGLGKELGLWTSGSAVVTGDDIVGDIDELMADGVAFVNMDTGEPLSTVRDRLTHANVYTGSEGIVEALGQGADIVICGRVTDIALYLGPLIHEFGWKTDDWPRLGMATAVAHAIECGGQATGGLYAGGWQDMPGLETLGYPIAEVAEDGTAFITKTPGTGGRGRRRHGQRADGLRDPRPGRLSHRRRDRGLQRAHAGAGRPRPGAGRRRHRAGAAGHAQGEHGLPRRIHRRAALTYTWPDA